MEFRTFFRHLETSETAHEYAVERLKATGEKFAQWVHSMQITLSAEDGEFCAACDMICGGHQLHSNAKDRLSIFGAIDELTDKVQEQIARHKDRVVTSRHADRTLPMEGKARSEPVRQAMPEETMDASEVIAFDRAWKDHYGPHGQA